MSKGNMFLGFARGSVGDVVFSHGNGEQLARARNRSPRNPRSIIQLLQRVLMKTVQQQYSCVQAICNHSFEGFRTATENQSEFIRQNLESLRAKLAEDNVVTDEQIMSYATGNFSSKNVSRGLMESFIIADGSSPGYAYGWRPYDHVVDEDTIRRYTPCITTPAAEMQDWSISHCDMTMFKDIFGLQPGDQMTFVFVYSNVDNDWGLIADVQIRRLVLSPEEWDETAVTSDGWVNYASFGAESQGSGLRMADYVGADGLAGVYVWLDGDIVRTSGLMCTGMACILSRKLSTGWSRSFARISPCPVDGGTMGLPNDLYSHFLNDAILSFMTEEQSSLYLNQAQRLY